VRERHYLLVKVQADDGVEGVGFCYAGNQAGEVAFEAVRALAPLLHGEDPYRVAGLWQKLYQESLLHGRAGAVMRAISALDIALWDHNAKAAGLPLYKYLGAYRTDSVAAYASGGYYLDGKTPAMLAQELAAYVEMGFSAVKIKVGRANMATERERMAAAREALGPDVLLMLDASNAWTDAASALRFAKHCYEPFDPYWLEEPFSPDDIANHARLARLTSIPIATGEIEAGRWRFAELMRSGGALILQPDAQVCGGITEFRRIAGMAESLGIPVCPHAFHDLHKHLAAATSVCKFVEYFTDASILNFTALLDRQSELRDGRIQLGSEPGLGFGFEESVVDKYADPKWLEV
jgi:L-alanine-DL-glutamate epimerase-like enolase superfamily enzyme